MSPLDGQPQPLDAGKDRPGIRIRPHAGLVRNPFDEIKAIKTLLEDVYKDAGDGRTLFREIVQNADDAGARRLRFTVLEQGWDKAQNSLLRGPAVLVANNGSFPKKDNEGIHRAIGGSKEDQVTKIGTFGIGLKSVFHICEAFLYIGAAQSEWRAGVLNPWVGTGGIEDEDPIHGDWSKVERRDLEHLRDAMTKMLGETSDGLLLWIPLRREEQLNRGDEGTRYGLGSHCPESQQLSSWFARAAPAALLLAQCGRLTSIETTRAQGPQELDGGERLLRVDRGTNEWVGRHHHESKWFPERSFEGEVAASADGLPPSKWSVVGSESLGADGLSDLQSHRDWPRIDTWSSDGRHSQVPRKALAHAAVTVLRPLDHDVGKLGIRLRWATFLPLHDDSAPSRGSRIVESFGSAPAWEIILHGYFWPSQDRKSIPGVTDEQDVGTGDAEMRDRWNRTLCKELLLPLLPRVLAAAVDGIEESAAHGLLERVVASELVKKRERSVRARHWLLPEVTANGVRWIARDEEARRVLAIPDWQDAPEEARKRFVESCGECTDGPVFVNDAAPRLAGQLGEWTHDEFEGLLNSIPVEAFKSAKSIRWVKGFVRHVLGPHPCPDDDRAALFVRWLTDRIGEGALDTARRSSARQARDELRQAWRDLGVAIPREWLVETPLDTSRAVAELAKDGVMGPGLLCMPTGRERDARRAERPEQQKLDRALTAIGQRLEQAGESGRLRGSRLLLAKTLLSIRSVRPMDDHLRGLPILRATRLPDEKEEAWSSDELRSQVRCRRVFAHPPSQDPQGIRGRGTQSRQTSHPKGTVRDLALALGEAVWLVNGDAVASVAIDVPTPDPEALASAVLHAEGFAKPTSRTPLLRRLEPRVSREAEVRRAVRALLAGRGGDVVGNHTPLFVADGESRRALHILLRLLNQSWRAVDRGLASSLSQAVLKGLSVDRADRQALHRLLGECLTGPVDWKVSNEDARHLLESLFSADPESLSRWRRMPLHRGVDGDRGTFDSRARRRTRSTGDIDLPDDLLEGVRLLDPDREVAHLYHVPKLDRDGALHLMLEHLRPWRYADRIVELVRCTDGPLSLPPNPGLRRLLRVSSWLPTCDGKSLAPGKVLIAPKEVLDAVRDLPAYGAFGDKHLPDDVKPDIWAMAEPVVREILGRMGRRRQVERLADALVPSRVAKVDDGAWLVMSEPTRVDESLISDALKTTLAGNHPGWKLLHLVTRVLEDSDRQLLVKFGKSLCAPVPPERQIEMLSLIADSKPAKDSLGGRVFRRVLECFAASDAFFENVLPHLTLPTQDGNWHPSRDVAVTEIGVARKHRPLPELRPILKSDRFDEIRRRCPDTDDREFKQDPLRDYFEPWRGQLPRGAVGAFLSLLGNGGEVADLAEEWLGEDLSIKGMRGELVAPNEESLWGGIVVRVSPDVLHGARVHTMNVVGNWVKMEADTDARTVFAQDPVRHPPRYWGKQPRDGFWSISLREVNPKDRTSVELVELLRETVEMWATRCLKLERDRVIGWWKRWIDESVVDLVPVLASIKACLPLTLRQLDVRSSRSLWKALRKAEQAQRKREQEPSKRTIDAEHDSLNSLAGLIEQPEHQDFLWKRVNELMMRYGYREDSALLELAQNADDALAQAAEIEGRPLATDARHFVVSFHETDDSPTMDVMHWGRSINDTGGPSFPEGKRRQWDQDLYFMMLMHLSGKPGEVPGDATASATTGRFGLGFKSVHLLSSSPSVVSGFMAFRIAGGLLPLSEEEPLPDDPSLVRGGRRVTRIRLPLRRDVGIDTLIESMFARFVQARVLLPVFGRQIRKVVVEGGPAPGVNAFDGTAIEGAPGWSLGGETILPSDPSHWRILRFRPKDAGQMHMGTLALAVGIRDGLPTRFPDFPFLWNVTPTSGEWTCGYVVNGPFKLNPGRTHVSLDDDTTRQAVRGLGNALGQGLIKLHDALTGAANPHWPMPKGDAQSVLSSLWEVLVSETNTPDRLRSSFLRGLHGNGRGVSAWMAARPVVPTFLPAPFPPRLPPLSSETSWEVVTDDLADPDLCAALAEIDDEDFRSLVGNWRIVSAETDRLLTSFSALEGTDGLSSPSRQVTPTTLLTGIAERWRYVLTPARLHALRPLVQDEKAWGITSNIVINGPWRAKIGEPTTHGDSWTSAKPIPARRMLREVDGTNGGFESLRGLLLQQLPTGFPDTGDKGLRDELLLSAFAPKHRLLDSAYIDFPEDLTVFRWLRGDHDLGAEQIAKWYTDVAVELRPAALRYLLFGTLRDELLRHLVSHAARPSWLQELATVRRMLESIRVEPWRRQRLLDVLFAGPPPPPPPPANFFRELAEWWDDADERRKVIQRYERRAWPEWLRQGGLANHLKDRSLDHWRALLILGACRSIGQTNDRQHRWFLEKTREQGWWDVFKRPDDSQAWMAALRTWQDHAFDTLPYPQWTGLFPAIYQLCRYLDVYINVLTSAGRRSLSDFDVTRLLRPRVDSATRGAGVHFDAPPAPLKMGRHWVLRELVRLGVIDGDHLYRYSYVPNEMVQDFLAPYGYEKRDSEPHLKARGIFDFMESQLGPEEATLHRCFDIPLRHVAREPKLQSEFGL